MHDSSPHNRYGINITFFYYLQKIQGSVLDKPLGFIFSGMKGILNVCFHVYTLLETIKSFKFNSVVNCAHYFNYCCCIFNFVKWQALITRSLGQQVYSKI